MTRISKLLSFIRLKRNGANITDVKVNPGGGANVTAEHFATPGDDAYPLLTDYVLLAPSTGTGRESAVGYLDPINTPKASEGDKRIYGRDTSGSNINEVWLKNDGSILISNDNGSMLLRSDGGSIVTAPNASFDIAEDGSIKGVNNNGSFELEVGGDFVVNGVTIDIAGNVTTPATVTAGIVAATTSLTVTGKEMGLHTHNQGNDSAGDTQVTTGAPN